LGTWTHVRFDVSFFQDGNSNLAVLQITMGTPGVLVFDNSEAPFPAPFAASPFARVRLMPFDFGKGYSVYYDNVSLTANLTLPGAQRPPVARKGR
jgi:hypothetical protein